MCCRRVWRQYLCMRSTWQASVYTTSNNDADCIIVALKPSFAAATAATNYAVEVRRERFHARQACAIVHNTVTVGLLSAITKPTNWRNSVPQSPIQHCWNSARGDSPACSGVISTSFMIHVLLAYDICLNRLIMARTRVLKRKVWSVALTMQNEDNGPSVTRTDRER